MKLPDLFYSDKAVFCLFVILMATLLTAFGKLPVTVWVDFVEVIAVSFVGGKTAHGIAMALKGKPPTAGGQ